ncbi:MAG: energy-coupling factor transporter ATPase [Candidatus Caldarchaeum sp.]|nr:energy-coupling factor transporter ATPase [Candidatus Caldarchaeum sp.]
MIEVKNLWWRYQDSEDWVLKDVNLRIHAGEFIGLVGVNGSGKTSLAMAMNGLIPHNYYGFIKGDVIVDGVNTKNSSVSSIAKNVGFVFSDPESQFVTMTVEEEIVFALENQGYPSDLIEDRLKWVLQIIRLSQEYLEKPPYELSGGEKQRVAIAAALVTKPKVIILDEPTSQLDPIGKQQVFDVLENLKREYNATVIVIEHRMERLAKLANRMVLLNDGRVLLDKPTHEFFQHVEELHNLGLYPPEWMSVAMFLKRAGLFNEPIPLTFDQSLNSFEKMLRKTNSSDGYCNKAGYESTTPLITVANVNYVYPDGTAALHDVSLVIGHGEFVALIGQNGSGKTTLAKCIAGIYRPSSGVIKIDDLEIGKAKRSIIATKVGYVFQNPDHQLFNETVEKELSFGPSNIGLDRDETSARVMEALRTVGLRESDLVKHPFFLQKGIRQRIAIASILTLRPRVIIVDEPTTGQDFKQSFEIMNFLKDLNQRGHTIIIITHDMPIVARYARRVICMANGRILLDGPTRDVFRKTEELAQSFVKPPDSTLISQHLAPYGFPQGLLTPEEVAENLQRLA